MACNAYLADITEPKHRTKRVAFMSGCFWIGYSSGKALSGVIKEELGFMYNFGNVDGPNDIINLRDLYAAEVEEEEIYVFGNDFDPADTSIIFWTSGTTGKPNRWILIAPPR